MTTIEAPQAIETRAYGYRFRSRLEARWATFFTELDLDFQYEPQGFELPGVGPYLPDFFVADWNAWVEIKPKTPTMDELLLCASLAGETRQRVLLFAGECYAAKHAIYQFHDGKGGMFNLLAECPKCRCVSALLAMDERDSILSKLGQCSCSETPLLSERGSRLLDAYTAARSARFEHGEARDV